MVPKLHLRLAAVPTNVVGAGPVEFEVLFALYSAYVARLAARLLGSDDADVDDVVQDVFWLAWRRLGRIADLNQARGWLATVTTRDVRRKLRRRRFSARFHGRPDSAEVPARGATAEDRVVLVRLYEVLDDLPTEHRLAWSLRYLEGEQLDAVAAACQCSLATAKRRVGAAKSVINEVFGDD
jgi:RNA polymerase sigma-70 factor (ECF subfamily)